MLSPTSQDSKLLLYKAAEEEFAINTLKVNETLARAERAVLFFFFKYSVNVF